MLRFTKMHGAGNDYIYVDCFAETLSADVPSLARRMSDRHTGVGADGLVAIEPSDVADVRMRMWNADGSPAEMCGNGIRCVARYAFDHGIARRESMTIETGRGVLNVQILPVTGKAERVRVDMGPPILEAAAIPTTLPGNPPLRVPIEVAGELVPVTCVSMGNPHCVVFVDALSDRRVHEQGPRIEHHPAFPRRTNVEFAQVVSPGEVRLRVWERGSGETMACGTGACAAVVAGVLAGVCEQRVLCRLPGGDLEVEWSAAGSVYLTGPAVEVFSGEWSD